jgi:DUF4097 and DUF4098 domain-containing protein YvlB
VHVKDDTSIHGLNFSSDQSIPKLTATRTGDGVLVQRPDYNDHWMHFTIGTTEQHIEVDVPAGSRVEIQRSSGATVAGLRAGISVRSQDGHIALTDVQGIVDAHSDDGYIEASNVRGDTLTLLTADGHVSLKDVTTPNLTARSNDGRIDATNLSITGGAQPQATLHSDDGSVHVKGAFASGGNYEISSNDGRIELGLATSADLTVTASTGDGSIVVDGKTSASDDDAHHQVIKLGSGSGAMRVSSGDGSIHLTTNGAF